MSLGSDKYIPNFGLNIFWEILEKSSKYLLRSSSYNVVVRIKELVNQSSVCKKCMEIYDDNLATHHFVLLGLTG